MKPTAFMLFSFIAILLFPNTLLSLDVKTYRNDVLGFEVSYPSNWEIKQSPGKTPFYIRNQNPEKLSSISVDVTNYSGDRKNFICNSIKNPEKFINSYKKRFPVIEFIQSGETSLGSFPAFMITFYYTLKNLNVEIDIATMQIVCVREGKLYAVTFETYMPIFEENFKDFQVILSSFNFR